MQFNPRYPSLNPKLYHAKVHLVHQKQHMCDWNGLEADIQQIRGWVMQEPNAQISPFAFLAMPTTSAAEQKVCASNWANHFSKINTGIGQPSYNKDHLF